MVGHRPTKIRPWLFSPDPSTNLVSCSFNPIIIMRDILHRAAHRPYYGYGRQSYGPFGNLINPNGPFLFMPNLRRYGTGPKRVQTAVYGRLPRSSSHRNSRFTSVCYTSGIKHILLERERFKSGIREKY